MFQREQNILRTRRIKTCYMDSVKEFYIGRVWIQCENRSCLKWRLLLKDDAGNIDSNAPWYCYMNIDAQFNKCSVAEEYFPKESQFQKHGLKYIYSKFPLGSLVLAKMQTWPRWPGILSPDPIDGQYVKYDFNGHVESHHVEFLGNPHSRSWTSIKYIDPYPSSFKVDECKRKKAWYKSALEEANKLLACSTQQRLDKCYLSKKGTTIIWPFICYYTQTFEFLSILNCYSEASKERRPMEISTEEDCIIIDGKAFVAGECIESITEQFKEIDYLMADFQGSL
uniref:Zinc finger CW-type and PWWP domain containing 2 n=1 Tax=Pseudonaja textilis TaxID=8673 RepID=A0A670Z207_PSETE